MTTLVSMLFAILLHYSYLHGKAHCRNLRIITVIISGVQIFKFYSSYVNSLYSHNPTHYASGGNAAVLQLDAGDTVYVRARVGNDNLLYGRGDEIYCTFSGYLIRQTANTGAVVG